MSELAVRVLRALGVGILVGLIAALVIVVISAVLPGVTISASFWGTVLGVLAFVLTLLTGTSSLR